MCIWPCRAAHHFSSSYCLNKKYLVFICFVSETRVPRGGLGRWVGDEPELPGGSSACPKALPELGNVRCAPSPAVKSSDGLLCHFLIHYLQLCLLSWLCSWPMESPCPLCPGQCSVLWRGCGGAAPWPGPKCAFRACQGLLLAAVSCRTIN